MNLSVNTHNVHFSSKRKLHFPLAICLIENSYNENLSFILYPLRRRPKKNESPLCFWMRTMVSNLKHNLSTLSLLLHTFFLMLMCLFLTTRQGGDIESIVLYGAETNTCAI